MHLKDVQKIIERKDAEIERLRSALKSFRYLVKEGGVPRYTVLPGAALNSLIEEVVDPLLKE